MKKKTFIVSMAAALSMMIIPCSDAAEQVADYQPSLYFKTSTHLFLKDLELMGKETVGEGMKDGKTRLLYLSASELSMEEKLTPHM